MKPSTFEKVPLRAKFCWDKDEKITTKQCTTSTGIYRLVCII